MSYYPISGLGAFGLGLVDQSTFDPSAVWSQWASGEPGATKAAFSIQAALTQMGYDTGGVDGKWGAHSLTAMNAFCAAKNIGGCNGMPSKVNLQAIYDALAQPTATTKPGWHIENGVWVPDSAGNTGLAQHAGMSTGAKIGIAAAAVVAIGVLAMMAKKRSSGGGYTSAAHQLPSHHYGY